MAIPLTAREPLVFKPEGKEKIEILVRVPTMIERDRYSSAMVRAGITFHTKNQIRDMTLAGIQAIYPAEEQEWREALMQELWQYGDAQQEMVAEQGRILLELHDKAKAAGKVPKPNEVQKALDAVTPSVMMNKLDVQRANAMVHELSTQFGILREAMASLAEHDSRRAYMNVQAYVIGWTGTEHQPDVPAELGLKQHEMDYLRLEIGEDAWEELSDFITSQMVINEDEEKNSDSLPENSGDQIGSKTSEPSSASSDIGTSTDSDSIPIPAKGSRRTTASSSGSTKSSGTKKAG
ncbi:MAG: hypothetical protein V4696_03700 [Pseudomonadota bacterium]